MNYPKVLYCHPDQAGESFQPSNGTDGMMFTDEFCCNCIHQHPDPDHEKQCMILMRTLVYYTTDPQYPKEWRFNAEGWPVCTAWQKWDWGNEDDGWNDPDDPRNPDAPVPVADNQLVMPFELMRILGDDAMKIQVTKHALLEVAQ